MSVVETKLDEACRTIDELVAFTQWLRDNPEFAKNVSVTCHKFVYPSSNLPDDQKRVDVLAKMRPYVDAMKLNAPIGEVQKLRSDYYYGFERKFGDSIIVSVNAHNQSVCEFVETDEIEIVYETNIPDDVKESYTVAVERPKVARICPKLFVD